MGRRWQKGHGERPANQAPEVKEHCERQLSDLQQAYGEAMLELRARKKLASLLGEEDEK